jgi:response regulator RpfG family c-di-GMP phosphodiesterase
MFAKPSIKTVTIKKLVWFGLIFLLTILALIAVNFRTLINEAMRDKGETVARAVEAALTSHMISGHYRDKQGVVESAALLPGIQNLRIVRDVSVNRQFKLPATDGRDDPLVARAFAGHHPAYVVPTLTSAETHLRVVYPYIARESGPIDCLSCHDAEPGEVLAVLDFRIDMSSYLGMSQLYLYILFGGFTMLLVVTAVFFARVFDASVVSPLSRLVEETRTSYQNHISIDTDRYESLELDYVATKINQFNQVVLAQNDTLTELNREIEATQREIILAMGYIGEARSKETANHVRRVAELAYMLACRAGLPQVECDWIREAAPMHDIGKVGIPDSILHKPGPLTEQEFDQMKLHAFWGHAVFKNPERPMLKAASIIAYHHHERWDGTGYPQGLSGEDIHVYGRIVAVADVLDALACRRCYKAPWPEERVYVYFRDNSGSQFDPNLVRILLENFDDAIAVIKKFAD